MLFAALPVCALDDPKVARSRYDDLAAKVNRGDLNLGGHPKAATLSEVQTLRRPGAIASVASVMHYESAPSLQREQVIALGRLGWSLRRIEGPRMAAGCFCAG